MTRASTLNRQIIEQLYHDALALSDEVRAAFELHQPETPGAPPSLERVAISVEGLRTTTRVMHVLAWLLNHRAFFDGELNEFQLRRHGVLPTDRPAEPAQLELLKPATRQLVAQTIRLHARVARLDAAWRQSFMMEPSAVARLQQRLGRAVGNL